MKIIKSVEIAYFRSLYKERITDISDLTVIFGRNDSGKSNILRALNLFFNQQTNPNFDFDFDVDFSHKRRIESENGEGVRKFIYIKVTFITPPNYRASLGDEFSVKRQWNISSGEDYHQDISRNVPVNRHQYVTRFLNQIQFHYIPAIKDRRIFSWLFQKIYGILVKSSDFSDALDRFSGEIQQRTERLFSGLEPVLGFKSALAAPKNLTELFGALDVDTIPQDGDQSLSLILQRGDGLQVRHIPEILKFISDNDERKFHVWGFEEPENSLELAAAFEESERFKEIASDANKQLFVTSHSPSFFTIDSPMASRLFVGRKDGISVVSSIPRGDEAALQLMGDNFYLPMISKSVKSALEEVVSLREEVSTLNERLAIGTDPILFVEGETDQSILRLAFSKLFGDVRCPFSIEAAGGTQKMKALHAEGPALNIAASGRRIFVLTDNDFDGRDVAPRNSVGKWTSIKNGAVWWVLKPTDEYVTQMRRVCFDANMHFFCIEDCFSVDVRREASIDIVDICSSYKYNAPRNYSIKVDHARLVKLAESDAVFKYSVFGPEHNAKKQFVEWLENRPAAEFEYFRPFFKELIAMLALVK